MKIRRSLLFGLLMVIVITFSVKNAGNVTVRYFGVVDAFEIPLFLLVLISTFIGMFIGAMADLFKRYQLKKAIQRQQEIMDELQKEIRSVRNLTLTGPEHETGDM